MACVRYYIFEVRITRKAMNEYMTFNHILTQNANILLRH
jgi:hypothetical protein